MSQSTPAKGKRRNVEKRREKSRFAARNRREKEAGIFTDLYVTVPIVSESTITHVDRIAVLRLAATLCRARRVAEKVFPTSLITNPRSNVGDIYSESSVNECLDGFLLIVDSTGLIIYISPNCSRSLGLTQTDLIGQDVHDYLHGDDSLSLVTGLNHASANHAQRVLRLKSVLSPRGRNLTLKSAVYKAVAFTVKKTVVEFPPIQARRAASPGESSVFVAPRGEMSDLEDDDDLNANADPVTPLDNTYYVMHGRPIPHCGASAMGDYHGPMTFMTRHTMDMKFSYCHDRLSDYLGYEGKALMGSSFYSLVHPADLPDLTASFKELYRKGQVCTCYYRLMVKNGGCVWITTSANTVAHSTRGHGGQYVVCIHQIICGPENRDVTADVQQTAPSLLCKMETDRKFKQTKIVGPTTEQLLQRAPTVQDYIPLSNTNGLPVNVVNFRNNSNDVMPKYSQNPSRGDGHGSEWLFRTVGGIELQNAGKKRGNGQYANAAFGASTKRVHIDAAETRTQCHGAPKEEVNRNISGARHNRMFLSSVVPLDAITQADIERVLFPPLPTTNIQHSNNNVGSSTFVDGQSKKDELSMLAPFIHKTDEILSLDFGGASGSHDIPISFPDEMKLEFSDLEDISTGSDSSVMVLPNSSDTAMDKVNIESIYRYLRDGCDDVDNGHPEAEGAGPPPLINWTPSHRERGPPPLIIMDSQPTNGQNQQFPYWSPVENMNDETGIQSCWSVL